jgi:hypothetical protein
MIVDGNSASRSGLCYRSVTDPDESPVLRAGEGSARTGNRRELTQETQSPLGDRIHSYEQLWNEAGEVGGFLVCHWQLNHPEWIARTGITGPPDRRRTISPV